MKRTVRFTLLLISALSVAPAAQTPPDARVGDNVNVLAVDRGDYLRGDYWGQRQQEPAIGVSSVNRSHIVAFYNDFRGVDFGATERPLPPQTSTLIARVWNDVKGFFARVVGRPAPGPAGNASGGGELGDNELAMSAEAFIGWSVSYDGGLSWIGGMMPGGPGDETEASKSSPAYGYEGASDPVVMSAPCGRFYVAWLAFTRADTTTERYKATAGKSALLLSRFQDLNNSDSQHTIQYQGTTLIATGQNSSNGHFLDKPEGTVKLISGRSCSQVTEEVVVTFTTFVGKGQTFVSKVNVARSTDGGRVFSTAFADDSYQQSQGTAVTTANGDFYLFWRTFYSPDTIVWTKTNSRGQWAKPSDLLAGEGMEPFDQPTLDAAVGPAFRSNGFPAAAATPDGRYVFVAWQERSGGTSTIMVKQLDVATGTWSAKRPTPGSNSGSPYGLGFFNLGGAAGPRVMPSLACAAGNKCLLTFYEARGGLSANGWISGIDRLVDYRGVFVTPGGSQPSFGNTFQISRYGYEPPATSNGSTWQDFLQAAETGVLDSDPERYAFQIPAPGGPFASLNWANYTHTGGGWVSFMGDYNAAEPLVKYATNGTSWSLATDPTAGDAFVTAWADNRNVVPPASGPASYPWDYSPPGVAGCVNPGSRDQSVMLATVSPTGLLMTAPYSYKPIGAKTEFPLTIWNNTGEYREFGVALSGNSSASFSPESSCSASECGDNAFSGPLRDGTVRINPYSSSSLYVYVTAEGEFTVTATQASSSLSRSLTFNRVIAPNPTYGGTNPTVEVTTANPVPKNPVPKNPVPKNPVPKNTYPEVYSVQDYEVTVEPSSSGDVGSYLSLFNVDKAYQDAYVFQVFLTKPTYAFQVSGCDVTNRVSGTPVANISDPSNPVPKNPVPKNPVPKNPVPKNPVPKNSVPPELFQNSTFTLGELAGTGSGLGAQETYSCAAKGNLIGGNCTKHASRERGQVVITLRAYQVKSDAQIAAAGGQKYNPTSSPPSFFVAESSCTTTGTGCTFVQDGPELVVGKTVAGVSPAEQRAGLTVQFPVGGVTVTNTGNRDAQPHQVSFYVSKASQPYGDPADSSVLPRTADGRIMEDTSPARFTKRLEGTLQVTTTGPGGGYTIPETAVRIPSDIPRGPDGTALYYLYAYADSERVVSELDEENNIVQGDVDLTADGVQPLKVLAPGFGLLGLQTPCTGFTCDKSGTMVLAWQFTNGAVAVDSMSSLPRLKFYQGCTVATPAPPSSYSAPDSSQTLLVTSDPNPTDLTSGNSGWQYFPNAGMTRSQYTWQYNFNAAGLSVGQCYAMYIEIPATGQTIGSSDPALKPFGPFHITPR